LQCAAWHRENENASDNKPSRFRPEGEYTTSQTDGRWTPEMIEEFSKWVAETKHSKLRLKVNH